MRTVFLILTLALSQISQAMTLQEMRKDYLAVPACPNLEIQPLVQRLHKMRVLSSAYRENMDALYEDMMDLYRQSKGLAQWSTGFAVIGGTAAAIAAPSVVFKTISSHMGNTVVAYLFAGEKFVYAYAVSAGSGVAAAGGLMGKLGRIAYVSRNSFDFYTRAQVEIFKALPNAKNLTLSDDVKLKLRQDLDTISFVHRALEVASQSAFDHMIDRDRALSFGWDQTNSSLAQAEMAKAKRDLHKLEANYYAQAVAQLLPLCK